MPTLSTATSRETSRRCILILDAVPCAVQAQAVVTPNPNYKDKDHRKHTFLLRRGLSVQENGFSLESAYSPGKFLVSGIPAGRQCFASEGDCASGECLYQASVLACVDGVAAAVSYAAGDPADNAPAPCVRRDAQMHGILRQVHLGLKRAETLRTQLQHRCPPLCKNMHTLP
jgi:hypothetical protein